MDSELTPVVTIWADAHFGGTGIFLDAGTHRLTGAQDLNDAVSSIQVPAGLVALVFEHADNRGGYGISADFLEDCPDLAPLGLDDKISYIEVFPVERAPNFVWRRGAVDDGRYVPGHWERTRVVEPPPNPVVAVSPPIPQPTGGIAVHASGPHAQQAQSLFTVILRGPDDPKVERDAGRFDDSLTCTFSALALGRYWVGADSKVDVEWPVSPSDQEVECHASSVTPVVVRFG